MHKTKAFEYFNRPLQFIVAPTPKTGMPNPNEDCLPANNMLLQEVAFRGFDIITTSEKGGREIHDIIPIEGKQDSYSNEGSGTFPFHVEVPQLGFEDRPDVIVLFCLRSVGEAKTYLIPFEALFAHFTEEEKETAKQPLFKTTYSESFGEAKEFMTAIMHSDTEGTLDLAEMKGTTVESEVLLFNIGLIINKYFRELAYEVNLKAGDMLFFDNKKCTHARGNFKDAPNYNQRWLKRCYLKRI